MRALTFVTIQSRGPQDRGVRRRLAGPVEVRDRIFWNERMNEVDLSPRGWEGIGSVEGEEEKEWQM